MKFRELFRSQLKAIADNIASKKPEGADLHVHFNLTGDEFFWYYYAILVSGKTIRQLFDIGDEPEQPFS